MRSSSTSTSLYSKTPSLHQLSWREDLIRQVMKLGEEDPSRAEDLHRRILFCNWSRYEVEKLGREGLDVSRVVVNSGFPGGMEAGGEIALKLLVSAIELMVESNKKEMLAELASIFVPALKRTWERRVYRCKSILVLVM